MRGLIYCSTPAFAIFGAYGKAYGKLTGRSRDPMSALGEHLWSILGTSWQPLGSSWVPLEPSWVLLGPSWVPLGSSWGPSGCPVLWGTPPRETGKGLTGGLREAYAKPTGMNQGVW